MKKTSVLTILLLAFLVIPFAAIAFEAKSGNSIYIGPDEKLKTNLFAAGNSITIDGELEGDLVCAGQSVTVNGKISGDVICAAQSIIINGSVDGNVRAAANTIIANNKIGKNFMAAGSSVSLGASSSIGWDAMIAAASSETRGKIGRDLTAAAASAIISGEIGNNAKILIDNNSQQKGKLSINNGAIIKGNLSYTANQDAEISDKATISGETIKKAPSIKEATKALPAFNAIGWLFRVFSSLVIGLVLVSLWREKIIAIADAMFGNAAAAIGWGAIIMFITPVICILLLITLIGIPLSLIIGSLWLIAIYISRILVAIAIGRFLFSKISPQAKESLIWAMILGILACYLVFALPFVGWLLSLLAIWWGLGSIVIYLKKA